MNWRWDPAKSEANFAKHNISFQTAVLVFNDPLALNILDTYDDELRWRTMGRIGSVVVLVIHTWPEADEGAGRIISARKATPHERKAYEEGDI